MEVTACVYAMVREVPKLHTFQVPHDERVRGQKKLIQYVVQGDCWICVSHRKTQGYPQTSRDGQPQRIYQFLYKLLKGPVSRGLEIRHLCGNKECIRPEHLEVGTRKDNMADAIRHGTTLRGERNPNVKLNAQIVDAIRKRRLHGEPIQQVADAYGVSISTISQIANHKAWRHLE